MTAMRYKYVVILKKNSERTSDLLSVLLCFFSALGFAVTGLRSLRSNPKDGYISLLIALILLVGLIVTEVVRRRSPTVKVRYRYLLLLAAIGWFVTPLPWIGLLFVLLTFLEYQTKRPLEIGFDTDTIVINTLIPRRFGWADFNNVILKDGLLTLDFRNNRLLQKEVVDDEEQDDADEEEFNMFCRERLAAAPGIPV